MATQQNATTLDGLTAQTEKAIEGIHTEGAGLNIQDMEAVLTNGLTALTTARTTCADAKAVQSQKQGDQRMAFKALRTLIIAVMAVFKVYFGARWNGQWEVLELPVGTLRVPTGKDRLIGIAERFERYLIANPAKESPSTGVTAVALTALIGAAKAARAAVLAAKVAVRNGIDVRDAAAKVVGFNLTLLRTRLGAMPEDDNRWYAFGYSRPIDPNTPEVPENVMVTVVGGQLAVAWSPARRADRYKVYLHVQGSEEAPVLVETTPVTEAYIAEVVPGTVYEVTVTAVNAAGESQPAAKQVVTV